MSKTKKLSKVLALVVMLALLVGILPMGAMAANPVTITKNSRTLTDLNDNSIGTISVSGMTVSGVSDAIWGVDDNNNVVVTIIVSLAYATTPASGTLTASITPTGGTAQSTNITVTSGEGVAVIPIGTIPYTIQVQSTEEAYVGGDCYVSEVDGEGVSLDNFTGDGSSATPYTTTAHVEVSGYPFKMSLRIIPDGANYGNYNSYSYTVLSTSQAGLTNYVGTYFLAEFPDDAKTLRFSVTNGAGVTKYYAITLSAESSTVTNTATLYAYCPAPGQFTNEGVTNGGWGDAYTSNGVLKINTATGISLGYFGGYAVYKFNSPVVNNIKNPYGVDFIVYGNAFWKNSEPGCIQVAEGAEGAPADVNGDGVIWYDIAASQYYTDNVEYSSIVYTNPNTSEDAGISTPGNNLGTRAAVSYSLNGVSGSVAVNPFHNHSWWPLFANYFNAATGRAEMAKISQFPFITSNPATPSQSSVSSTLTFTGMRLKSVNTTLSENFKFGYADAHGNYQVGGNDAYNPYALGTASISTSSDYNNWLTEASSTGGQASGGDPIDISWAVYPAKYDTGTKAGQTHPQAGEPVYDPDPETGVNRFKNIQFVRIYTGAALNNGINGELSTEVCGIATVSGTGTGNTTVVSGATLSVTGVSSPVLGATITSTNTFNVASDTTITVTYQSSGNYVYVNSSAGIGSASFQFSLGEGETQIIRVIAKDSTTGLPYIGFMKLIGS